MSVSAQASVPTSRLNDLSAHSASAESLLAAVVYADLFDYPLSPDELRRFQVGTRLSIAEVRTALSTEPLLITALIEQGGLHALRGRVETFDLRSLRAAHARRLWPRARLYVRLVAHLPFVRFVSVTGALAVDNLGARPDIDLLVVAAMGRVWICRRAVIFLVRLARLVGDEICPNYIISESNLTLDQRDFFTAHELAQMVPLAGADHYRQMILRNKWAIEYLPCAFDRKFKQVQRCRKGVVGQRLESLLSLTIFNRWEKWELNRMRKQLLPLLGKVAEVVCSAEQCKGHTGLHRQSVLTRFVAALRSRELYGPLQVVERELKADSE
ncbi:MAG: hypothetical protein ABIO92_04355 [Chloroflexia bacterium]